MVITYVQTPHSHLLCYPYNSIRKAEGVIISSMPRSFSTDYIVGIRSVTGASGKTKKVSGKILLRVRDKELIGYPAGTYLIIENLSLQNLQPPENPSGFDYKKYMGSKGIFFEGKADTIKTVPRMSFLSFFQGARKSLERKIKDHLLYFPEEKELLFTITMGKDKVPYFLQSAGVKSGTYHLLVISGLHVGFILLFLRVLFIPFAELNNRHPKLFPVFALIALWFYTGITGFRVPVVRAVLMCSFFFAGEIFERDMDIITSIMAAAFLLLIINPSNLFDASFQLSFLATTGIVLFWKRFKLLDRNYIKTIILTSLAAQIATLPLISYHFGYFYPAGLINNILFVPLTGVILILSIISFIIPILFPLLRVLLTVFIRGITLSAQFSPCIHITFSVSLIVAFYSLCIFLLYSPRKKSINTLLISAILISVSLHFFMPYRKLEPAEEIYFLSFSRPSVVYIKDVEATIFLADHYKTKELEDILIPLLYRKGVKSINIFYTTISYNHTATFNTLRKRFNINRVYEVEDIQNVPFYPYLDISYHKTYPSMFEFLTYGQPVSLSDIKVAVIGEEKETISYIINKNHHSILLTPFIGQETAEKLSDKFFDIVYTGDIKNTKKTTESLSSLKYSYLILPQRYKKFEELIKTEKDTFYLKHAAVKVLFNKNICVNYHYRQ